ncbi:MAG: hypothetical protein JW760_10560 [Spirochaetales bacterium]|nr:hypothetical protein [Spirochaetales bacterium]
MRFYFLFLLLLTVPSLFLSAQVEQTFDKNDDGKTDTWITLENDDVRLIRVDTSFNGKVDYILRTDLENRKIYEEIDYNHDAKMDDFYYYLDGILEHREIDSNYDGQVDIWVYLQEGVYISEYARDTDYDGVVDLRKTYAEETVD